MSTPNRYAAPDAGHPRIAGVKVKPLRTIADERGWLMEILRADEPDLFTRFGQVYVSATYPGVIKGWHYHRLQTDTFVCLGGMIKLVLIDTREDSATRNAINEFFMGTENRLLVQIPPLVYHGWKCISTEVATVLNIPNETYKYDEPDEYRLEPHGSLPYDWARKDG